MNKVRIAVLFGGRSSEHDVSLRSGSGVLRHLDYAEYEVCPVIISREGLWHCADHYSAYSPEKPFDVASFLTAHGQGEKSFPRFLLSEEGRPDVAFPVLHGRFGEDGTLQGLLDIYNIPFAGSGVLGSALAMHKRKAKELYRFYNLPTPDYSYYSRAQWEQDNGAVLRHLSEKFGYPIFAKVPEGGSSIGVGRAGNREELKQLAESYFQESEEVLFEKSVKGVEVSCGVLTGLTGKAEPLLPTEIVPATGAFFDYEAKYKVGASREITPARITPPMMDKVRRLSVQAHEALHCRDFSRTDMILDGEKIFILETNTLPGFTETSLLPQGAAAVGISYPALLDRIIHCALKRAGR